MINLISNNLALHYQLYFLETDQSLSFKFRETNESLFSFADGYLDLLVEQNGCNLRVGFLFKYVYIKYLNWCIKLYYIEGLMHRSIMQKCE